jgi:hypothetical protein
MMPDWKIMSRDCMVKWGLRILSSFVLGMILLAFYWVVLDRSPPSTIQGGEVMSYQERPDGSWILFVRWRGERHRVCNGYSKRWLSAGAYLPLQDIAYPPDSQSTELGPYEWEVPVEIPAYFASTGHVRGAYSIRILYSCNPLQEYLFPIPVEPPPVPFEIPD